MLAPRKGVRQRPLAPTILNLIFDESQNSFRSERIADIAHKTGAHPGRNGHPFFIFFSLAGFCAESRGKSLEEDVRSSPTRACPEHPHQTRSASHVARVATSHTVKTN